MCSMTGGVAVKTNIADSLEIIVQLERRPGRRYIAEVLELGDFNAESDKYEFTFVYQEPVAELHRH